MGNTVTRSSNSNFLQTSAALKVDAAKTVSPDSSTHLCGSLDSSALDLSNGPFSVNYILLVYQPFGGQSISLKSILYTGPPPKKKASIQFTEKGPLPNIFSMAMCVCVSEWRPGNEATSGLGTRLQVAWERSYKWPGNEATSGLGTRLAVSAGWWMQSGSAEVSVR